MDWNVIGQDIISSTISGVLVIIFGGLIAWIAYTTGIKGKERNQNASERKNKIYIPLKYELKSLISAPNNIWKELKVTEIEEVVEKNDELVVNEHLWKRCDILLQLINAYNLINLYTVTGDILCKRFREKYIELYGSITHPMMYWDELQREEYEYEEDDQAFTDFQKYAYDKKNIDIIFKTDSACEEYYQDLGQIGPTEKFLTQMFACVLPEKEQMYVGIQFESVNCKELIERRISPAEYMAHGFNFYKEFEESDSVKEKQEILNNIKELSFDIYEDVVEKIRSIGKKYEAE